MNYYAEGGQAHGLKTIAKSLQSHGRYGDTMLAHINPKEAEILKALGGSGTTNPVTGLKEYWGIGIGGVGIGSDYHGIGMKSGDLNLGGVAKGLGGIASDLGIVGQIAATYFGGPIGAALYAGLASNGGKSGSFDLKRAALAGAMAYGAQQLTGGLEGAGGGGSAGASAGADATASEVASTLGTEASTAPLSQSAMLADQAAGFGDAGLANIQSGASYAGAPTQLGIAGADASFGQMADTGLTEPPPSMMDRIGSTASEYGSKLNDMSPYKDTNWNKVWEGTKGVLSGDKAALEGFKASGATLSNTALPMYMGYTGTVALDEADKLKEESDAARALAESDLAEQRDRTEKSRLRGVAAMSSNPYMFAIGGEVPQLNNMPAGGLAGIQGMRDGYAPMITDRGDVPQYAKGGQPRFLSGGGDGMSDSIHATIEGKQEARLADGEFVVPADVVSHLGNGSSKAGAKQLYSMMDKVRSARTGTKKQGKQINPSKFMPA